MGFDFPTDQSCEGHIEKDHGLPYPWVQVYAEEPEGYEGTPEMDAKWISSNQVERDKMIPLLEEFYHGRNTEPDTKIIMDDMGQYGAFRLQSQGAAKIRGLPKSELVEKHSLYVKEMADFGAFLKEKFFNS